MQIATIWLVYDEKGSKIPVVDVTPPEALFLDRVRRRHKDDREPKVVHIHNVREVERSNTDEKTRLEGKYGETTKTGEKVLEQYFPGPSPSFPETFEKAGFVVDNTQPKEGKRLVYPELPPVTKETIDSAQNDVIAQLIDQNNTLTKQVEALLARLDKKPSKASAKETAEEPEKE